MNTFVIWNSASVCGKWYFLQEKKLPPRDSESSSCYRSQSNWMSWLTWEIVELIQKARVPRQEAIVTQKHQKYSKTKPRWTMHTIQRMIHATLNGTCWMVTHNSPKCSLKRKLRWLLTRSSFSVLIGVLWVVTWESPFCKVLSEWRGSFSGHCIRWTISWSNSFCTQDWLVMKSRIDHWNERMKTDFDRNLIYRHAELNGKPIEMEYVAGKCWDSRIYVRWINTATG